MSRNAQISAILGLAAEEQIAALNLVDVEGHTISVDVCQAVMISMNKSRRDAVIDSTTDVERKEVRMNNLWPSLIVNAFT